MVFVFLVLAGCVEDLPSDVAEMEEDFPRSEDSMVGGNATEGDTVVVYLENYKFDPYMVTISEGDTVKWVKKDHPAQIIKSNVFQSPTLREGDTFSYTFTEPGNYDYQIVSHPWAPGGIVVVEAD